MKCVSARVRLPEPRRIRCGRPRRRAFQTHDVVATRMRPFSDGVEGFAPRPRRRPGARQESADRDSRRQHARRSRGARDRSAAQPHGPQLGRSRSELPDERIAHGKPPVGTVRLEGATAAASAHQRQRRRPRRGLRSAARQNRRAQAGRRRHAGSLSEPELPRVPVRRAFDGRVGHGHFGRGVGLDVVQDAARSAPMGGAGPAAFVQLG